MPELPEVETVRLGISPYLLNTKITKIQVRNRNMRWPIPKALEKQAVGSVIQSVTRRGKYLLLTSQAGTIIIHLGMSGVLTITDSNTVLKKHDHVDFVLANQKILRLNDPRRFGCVLWSTEEPLKHRLLVDLAPEPLGHSFNAGYLAKVLRLKKTAIKIAIMNNKLVVGVGNIYASESLFLSGIHPQRIANTLTEAECVVLVKSIKTVLRKSIKAGGTTLKDFANAEGKPGYFAQKLNVYGKKDQLCSKCGTLIRSLVIANRATYFCEICQKSKY